MLCIERFGKLKISLENGNALLKFFIVLPFSYPEITNICLFPFITGPCRALPAKYLQAPVVSSDHAIKTSNSPYVKSKS